VGAGVEVGAESSDINEVHQSAGNEELDSTRQIDDRECYLRPVMLVEVDERLKVDDGRKN
jgi:hypothetical protein